MFEEPRVEAAVRALVGDLAQVGGRALLVGGCVRDARLGRALREVDVEVFGIGPAELCEHVARRFASRVVGRDFPVLVLDGLPVDIALPRRARAAGTGDFAAGADPQLPVAESLARRDFTLNAMALDLERSEWIDPHGGAADLDARRLRHTSARFGEDPLRVLRGMQLVARFELDAVPETLALCRTLEPGAAPRERLRREWRKLLLDGVRISRGLAFLRDVEWLRFYPELAALVGCAQDPEWHPEGDVWQHTLHCLDAFAAARLGDAHEDWIVGLAVLCHDLGKPATTRERGGRTISHGHEPRGAALAQSLLERLTDESSVIREVCVLVADHLAPAMLFRDRERAGDAAIRRLARRVGRIDRLVRVAAADHAGRPPRPTQFEAGAWLLERARALDVVRSEPAPLVHGRDLLSLGLEPGPALGRWLDACYEAQLAGTIRSREEGVAWVERQLQTEPQPGD